MVGDRNCWEVKKEGSHVSPQSEHLQQNLRKPGDSPYPLIMIQKNLLLWFSNTCTCSNTYINNAFTLEWLYQR